MRTGAEPAAVYSQWGEKSAVPSLHARPKDCAIASAEMPAFGP